MTHRIRTTRTTSKTMMTSVRTRKIRTTCCMFRPKKSCILWGETSWQKSIRGSCLFGLTLIPDEYSGTNVSYLQRSKFALRNSLPMRHTGTWFKYRHKTCGLFLNNAHYAHTSQEPIKDLRKFHMKTPGKPSAITLRQWCLKVPPEVAPHVWVFVWPEE